MKTFKIYSLSNFQTYNTVLLTIITMLHIRSRTYLYLVILINNHLYPLPPTASPAFGNYVFVLCIYEFVVCLFKIPHISDII